MTILWCNFCLKIGTVKARFWFRKSEFLCITVFSFKRAFHRVLNHFWSSIGSKVIGDFVRTLPILTVDFYCYRSSFYHFRSSFYCYWSSFCKTIFVIFLSNFNLFEAICLLKKGCHLHDYEGLHGLNCMKVVPARPVVPARRPVVPARRIKGPAWHEGSASNPRKPKSAK